jgi:hypothetical protein
MIHLIKPFMSQYFMKNQDLHDFLFKLYDFTDRLADEAESDPSQGNVRILTLIFIEQYFDSIGRGEISQAARESGADAQQSLSEAHRRIDELRGRISSLVKKIKNPQLIERCARETVAQWLKNNESHGE